MTSTFLDCYEDPLIDVVHGYTGVGDAMTYLTELHESIGWSAGGLVSTASDLIAFARGLFGGELFDDPVSLAAMTTDASGSFYGLGIALQEDYRGHAGGIAGFRSLLNYVPEFDTVVVILYNHDGADPEPDRAEVLNPDLPLLRAEECGLGRQSHLPRQIPNQIDGIRLMTVASHPLTLKWLIRRRLKS